MWRRSNKDKKKKNKDGSRPHRRSVGGRRLCCILLGLLGSVSLYLALTSTAQLSDLYLLAELSNLYDSSNITAGAVAAAADIRSSLASAVAGGGAQWSDLYAAAHSNSTLVGEELRTKLAAAAATIVGAVPSMSLSSSSSSDAAAFQGNATGNDNNTDKKSNDRDKENDNASKPAKEAQQIKGGEEAQDEAAHKKTPKKGETEEKPPPKPETAKEKKKEAAAKNAKPEDKDATNQQPQTQHEKDASKKKEPKEEKDTGTSPPQGGDNKPSTNSTAPEEEPNSSPKTSQNKPKKQQDNSRTESPASNNEESAKSKGDKMKKQDSKTKDSSPKEKDSNTKDASPKEKDSNTKDSSPKEKDSETSRKGSKKESDTSDTDDTTTTTTTNKSNADIGFLHIGQTTSHQVNCLLRHATHIPDCNDVDRTIPNESLLSQRVSASHHISPQHQEQLHHFVKTRFDSYLVTTRHPLSRLIAALFGGKGGKSPSKPSSSSSPQTLLFRQCFPHVNDFVTGGLAQAVRPDAQQVQILSNGTCTLEAAAAAAVPKDKNESCCRALAWDVVQGVIPVADTHNFFNFQYFAKDLLVRRAEAQTQEHSAKKEPLEILLLRAEHVAEDWTSIHQVLGQDPVTISPPPKKKDATLTRDEEELSGLSREGRKNLCRAMCGEINIYVRLLRAARNLSPADLETSAQELATTCPWGRSGGSGNGTSLPILDCAQT